MRLQRYSVYECAIKVGNTMLWWKSLFVYLSVVLSNIYCENYYWPNDDGGQSENRQMSFDEHRQQYSSHHHQHQQQHHHQQSNMESTKMTSMANIRTISETYADSVGGVAGGEGRSDSIPIDGIVNRKKIRRTNNRRRKIGSNNGGGSNSSSNKKSIFRRGQRHRNNKNGNVHSSRQQISLCFHFSSFLFILSLCFISFFLYHSSVRSFVRLFVCFNSAYLFFFFRSLHNQRNKRTVLKNLGNVRAIHILASAIYREN